ncbi:TPA: hypothetical protein KPE78_001166 [Clostridioides difficile]|nr:hypothetical protein [Clostridioides difficile]MBH7476169.1 hypothetical protein [Clostridioides difficile]MBY1699478.1 hypothetical protein [Clostridioides difficile]MBZ0554072.1 hypothetical protein [Clostridioides difficile]MBZ0630868.1 hypothetical protein [Clostridioides difficile]
MGKARVVKHKILADSLVWLGFEYTKNKEGKYIFKRDSKFDRAWKDLHYLRAKYDERVK